MRVFLGSSGAGSVTVSVAFPRATAAQVEDLKTGLHVADLRAAGWAVDGPRAGPSGMTLVSASHTFSSISQVPALVADIAGSGPEADRPFRLNISEVPGFLHDSYTATGTVDLKCSLSCFDDAQLAKSLGYALGMPSSQAHQLIPDPGKDIQVRFEVVMPGRVTGAHVGATDDTGTLVWAPVLGQTTTVTASSAVVNESRVAALGIAVGAGALVVLVTAFTVVWTGRRRHRWRHRGGVPVGRYR